MSLMLVLFPFNPRRFGQFVQHLGATSNLTPLRFAF